MKQQLELVVVGSTEASLNPIDPSYPHGFAVGAEVGAKRWPYFAAHPDCWGTPWKGIVLAINDPKAWQGTLAFGLSLPSQEAVDRHVAVCLARGLGRLTTPVLWNFGDRHEAFWETITSLRPYADDLRAWEQALWTARQKSVRRAA